MLFHVGYLTTMKYSVTYADVTPIDHMLAIALFGFICDLMVAKCMGYSLSVDKEVRCALFTRSTIGVLGHMSVMYGIMMVPIVCHLTISATIPFWAAFFGYYLLRETTDTFTKLAMIFCIFAIALFATSPYIVREDSDDEVIEE